MNDISSEDVTAMRREGDLSEFVRSLIRRPGTRKPAPQAPAPPGHTPGKWPSGTRPPDPPPPIPDTEVARAVQEYRDWMAAGRPKIQTACECEPCRLLGPTDHTWSDQ